MSFREHPSAWLAVQTVSPHLHSHRRETQKHRRLWDFGPSLTPRNLSTSIHSTPQQPHRSSRMAISVGEWGWRTAASPKSLSRLPLGRGSSILCRHPSHFPPPPSQSAAHQQIANLTPKRHWRSDLMSYSPMTADSCRIRSLCQKIWELNTYFAISSCFLWFMTHRGHELFLFENPSSLDYLTLFWYSTDRNGDFGEKLRICLNPIFQSVLFTFFFRSFQKLAGLSARRPCNPDLYLSPDNISMGTSLKDSD